MSHDRHTSFTRHTLASHVTHTSLPVISWLHQPAFIAIVLRHVPQPSLRRQRLPRHHGDKATTDLLVSHQPVV